MLFDFSPAFKWAKAQQGDVVFKRKLQPIAEKLAEEYLRLLIKNIKSNAYGFPLSDATRARRLRKGADLVPLVYSGEYLSSIYRDGPVVKVRDGKHSNGLTYVELSFILEHGRRDKNIPAFPVWSRTFDDFSPRIEEEYNKAIKKYFFKNPIFVGFPKLKKGRL